MGSRCSRQAMNRLPRVLQFAGESLLGSLPHPSVSSHPSPAQPAMGGLDEHEGISNPPHPPCAQVVSPFTENTASGPQENSGVARGPVVPLPEAAASSLSLPPGLPELTGGLQGDPIQQEPTCATETSLPLASRAPPAQGGAQAPGDRDKPEQRWGGACRWKLTSESWNASWETAVLGHQGEAPWEQEGGPRAPPKTGCARTRAQPCKLTCAHVHAHTGRHTRVYTCAHTHTCIRVRTVRVHTDTRVYAHWCTHA